MFEQLFGSRTRIKLLKLFLLEPVSPDYYVRQICRKTGEHINSIRRELANLANLGLIRAKRVGKKLYYEPNLNFILFPELKNLFMKSCLLIERALVKKINRIGKPKLLILTGFFTNVSNVQVDMLLVGRINRQKLARLIKKFEKEMGRPIRYSIMSNKEFKYRHNLTDRFLFDILENKKLVLINKSLTQKR